MRDLKNMARVNDQIRTDRIFTTIFSVAGSIMGCVCVVFAIDVLLG